MVELSGIGFPGLQNLRTATAGSLTMYYWDELADSTPPLLAANIGEEDTVLTLGSPGDAERGSLIQVEGEVMRIEEVLSSGTQYQVTRGAHTTAASAHAPETPIYHLAAYVSILPFPRDFFGSPACGDWAYPILLPNVRIACAELFVTNSMGAGPAGSISLTETMDSGLRTLGGGQYSMQLDGYLAIQTGAIPDLLVEGPHAIRDMYAVVKRPPKGGDIQMQVNRSGAALANLSIPDGSTVSSVVNGFGLRALATGTRLGLDITAVGVVDPGADLTLIIRL
jgi:hypothetical protein